MYVSTLKNKFAFRYFVTTASRWLNYHQGNWAERPLQA